MTNIEIKNQYVVGHNASYTFGVGQVGDLWIGFATGGGHVFVFAQISENHSLGIKDRDKAILLTGAMACDFEGGYGGIDVWNVPPSLRGDPEKFRCSTCLNVGCLGSCKDNNSFDLDVP